MIWPFVSIATCVALALTFGHSDLFDAALIVTAAAGLMTIPAA